MKNIRVIGAIFLFAVGAAAQDDTIRVATNLVTLNVSVQDRKGNAANGLSLRDFKLTDNGKAQEIETFSDAAASVSFGIVYDMHPATTDESRAVLDALKQFTERLGSGDDYFVTVFNERGSLTTDFVPTEDQIRRQADTGARSLYDAIFAASNKMNGARNHKRLLLVLTDGADHSSKHSFKQLKAQLRTVNLPVYAVTFSSTNQRLFSYSDMFGSGRRETLRAGETNDIDRGAVADLAKTTGGHSYDGNARNRAYLSSLMSKVRDEVKGQYVIGFYPDELDGKYHKLTVTVAGQKQKRLKISNRKGYQSPKR
ncbi:MAG TPA: VWA domain-containing protein [Pyrinomonadaceae bacterium]|jgi:VWFA-related protein|nr:VWA domain-containing protein [Pyrinomonadaceae bacterium]